MERPRHHHYHHPCGGGSDLQLHSLIHSVERDIQRLQQMEDNDTLKGIHIRAVHDSFHDSIHEKEKTPTYNY